MKNSNDSKLFQVNTDIQGEQEINASKSPPSIDFKSLPQSDE